MKRDIYKTLCRWKDESTHRPLLIRGARQTGKTYIVTEFGKNEFNYFISLNFERNPEYKDIFISYNPQEILEKISLYTGKRIITGKTLLFFDEIQECPEAILSMRYFSEELPDLHLIAAGSLVEFTMNSEKFRVPVGRIQYLYMFPLSFGEFLCALGQENLRIHLSDLAKIELLPESLCDKLNEYVRKYFITGGMPAVVKEYCTSSDIMKCQRIQRSILDTYVDDFAKYSGKSKHQYLKKVFNAVPSSVGRKFVYANVDSTMKSRDLKEALDLLETAGIVHRIKRTTGAGVPLAGGVKESYFKIIFLDIGLFHAISGIYAETAKGRDFNSIFKGAVAEQFVGQEIIAHQDPYYVSGLFYWCRDARNSSAEIDYLIEKGSDVIPVEVKSGSVGRMKSLQIFISEYKSKYAVRISQSAYHAGKPVISFPFYGIESIMKAVTTGHPDKGGINA